MVLFMDAVTFSDSPVMMWQLYACENSSRVSKKKKRKKCAELWTITNVYTKSHHTVYIYLPYLRNGSFLVRSCAVVADCACRCISCSLARHQTSVFPPQGIGTICCELLSIAAILCRAPISKRQTCFHH